MSSTARYLTTLAVAFIAWRVLVELMAWPVAAVVAVVAGAATWMLTRTLARKG